MTTPQEREALAAELQGKSDTAYCKYIEILRRDECLGWEHKVKTGKFGEPELKAHTLAAEHLGMHRAFAAAAADVRAALAAQPVAPKPLDDPRLQEMFSAAIDGALTFGYRGNNEAPEGHWLRPWWEKGRAAAVAESQPVAPAREPIDVEELRRALCAVGIVGTIDGRDVIRRDSVLDLIDRRLNAHR
jgi:hypothetical protein